MGSEMCIRDSDDDDGDNGDDDDDDDSCNDSCKLVERSFSS